MTKMAGYFSIGRVLERLSGTLREHDNERVVHEGHPCFLIRKNAFGYSNNPNVHRLPFSSLL